MQPATQEALVDVLGWSATICFALILAPQIVLNQMRRSCEGFSISLLLLWHIGAAAVFPFFMFEEEPLPLMLQGGLFTLASVVCEVQFYAFRPGQERPPARWKLWALGLVSFGLSAGMIASLMLLFKAVDQHKSKWLIDGIGSIISSLCFALGFLPQLNLMFSTRSSEGFSVGVSLLDMTGSLLSIGVLTLEAEGHRADADAVMPYAIIVAMQSLLLIMALVVYPDPKRWLHTRRALATVLDACKLSNAAASLRRGADECEAAAAAAADGVIKKDGALELSPSSVSLDMTQATSSASAFPSSNGSQWGEGDDEEEGGVLPGGYLASSYPPSIRSSSLDEEEEAEEEMEVERRMREAPTVVSGHFPASASAGKKGKSLDDDDDDDAVAAAAFGRGGFVDVELGEAEAEAEAEGNKAHGAQRKHARRQGHGGRRKTLYPESAGLEPSQ